MASCLIRLGFILRFSIAISAIYNSGFIDRTGHDPYTYIAYKLIRGAQFPGSWEIIVRTWCVIETGCNLTSRASTRRMQSTSPVFGFPGPSRISEQLER